MNGDPVDRFTVAHGMAGVVIGLTNAPIGAAVSLAIGWEVLERYLKDRMPEAFPHSSQDRLQNSILDACAVLMGWGVGLQLRNRSGA
jgi:hypothetical protein